MELQQGLKWYRIWVIKKFKKALRLSRQLKLEITASIRQNAAYPERGVFLRHPKKDVELTIRKLGQLKKDFRSENLSLRVEANLVHLAHRFDESRMWNQRYWRQFVPLTYNRLSRTFHDLLDYYQTILLNRNIRDIE